VVAAYVAANLLDDDVAFTGMVNGDATALYGSMIPLAAMGLARATHAPNLTILLAGWLVNPDLSKLTTIPDSEFMPELRDLPAEGFVPDYPQLFSIHRGEVTVGFSSGAQVDQHGNINAVVIGDHDKPDVRLLGPVFQTEHTAYFGREMVMMGRHSARNFVTHVDFISAAGFAPDGSRPAHLPGSGPAKVITPLCVFTIDPTIGRLAVESIHPGVTAEEVIAQTGFPLGDLSSVSTTPLPTREQLELLRRVVDPHGLLLGAPTQR
jgi:glutaconate CoA-transferase subunit B